VGRIVQPAHLYTQAMLAGRERLPRQGKSGVGIYVGWWSG